MSPKEIERAAYVAAYRIVTADTYAPELACPGARRSYAIDTIAEIIKDVFEPYDVALDECRRTAETALDARARGRASVLVELPQRASSGG